MKLLLMAATKKQRKKNSVIRHCESLDHIREKAQKLNEVLSPKKLSPVNFNTSLPLAASPSLHDDISVKVNRVSLYKAKMMNGEEIDYAKTSIIKPLRFCEFSEEFLVEVGDDDIIMRKKIIDITRLEEIYGVEYWKIQEVFKIYMGYSTFLPEIFYAYLENNLLTIYMTYFSGGNLSTLISPFQRFTELETREVGILIAAGVAQLHERSLVLTILNPWNVKLDRNSALYIDVVWCIVKHIRKVDVSQVHVRFLPFLGNDFP